MKKYLLSLILPLLALVSFAQTSNLPSSLGTFTVFKEAPLPVTIIMPSGYNVLNPVVEVWNNNVKLSDTTSVTISGDTVKFTLTKAQLAPLVRNPYFFVKFDGTYAMGAQLNPTIGVGTPISQTKTITLPSNAVVRVSIVGSASEAEQSALRAKAYADSAATYATGSQTAIPSTVPDTTVNIYTVSTAGTYTNFGGVVVTSGDLTSGLVQLRKTAGVWAKVIVPIELGNYAVKSYVDEKDDELEDLVYVTTDFPYGRTTPVSGASTTADRTRFEGTSIGQNGKVSSVEWWCFSGGAGFIQHVRKTDVSGTIYFQLIEEVAVNFVTGQNIIPVSWDVLAGDAIGFYSLTAVPSKVTAGITNAQYLFVGHFTSTTPTSVGIVAATDQLQMKASVAVITGTVKAAVSTLQVTATENQAAVASVTSKVDDNELVRKALATDGYYGKGGRSVYGLTPASGSTASTGFMRSPNNPVTDFGAVDTIRYYGKVIGTGVFRFYRPNGDGTWNNFHNESVTVALGLQSYASFTPFIVQPGDIVGFYSSSGQGQISYTTGIGNGLLLSSGDGTGSSVTLTNTGNRMYIQISVNQLSVKDDVNTLKSEISSLDSLVGSPYLPRGRYTITSQTFPSTTTPPSWVLGTGWTVNNGLISPTSGGGYDNYTLFGGFTAAMRKTTRARIKLTNTSSQFGICYYPMESPNYYYGTVCMVNGSAGTISLIPWTGSNAAYGPGRSVNIGFTLVADREYLLTVTKVMGVNTFTFTDTVTQQTVSISSEQADGGNETGRQWGKVGLMYLSGSFTCTKFEYVLNVQMNPRFVVIGDSNTEGANALGSNYQYGYAHLMENERRQADVLIAGRGGDETTNVLQRVGYEVALDPEYVVINMGTNDGNTTTWLNNMTSLIALFTANGVKPVLCTLIPKTGSDAKNITINNYIRNYQFGPYPYIDLAKSVSVNNDGVTLDTSLFAGDGIHMNVSGNAKAFQQTKIDAPFLYD